MIDPYKELPSPVVDGEGICQTDDALAAFRKIEGRCPHCGGRTIGEGKTMWHSIGPEEDVRIDYS